MLISCSKDIQIGFPKQLGSARGRDGGHGPALCLWARKSQPLTRGGSDMLVSDELAPTLYFALLQNEANEALTRGEV